MGRDAGAVLCWFGDAVTSFLYASVSFPSPEEPGPLRGLFDVRHVFS